MTTILPASFPRKEVTTGSPLARLQFVDWLPPWGGPAEAA